MPPHLHLPQPQRPSDSFLVLGPPSKLQLHRQPHQLPLVAGIQRHQAARHVCHLLLQPRLGVLRGKRVEGGRLLSTVRTHNTPQAW